VEAVKFADPSRFVSSNPPIARGPGEDEPGGTAQVPRGQTGNPFSGQGAASSREAIVQQQVLQTTFPGNVPDPRLAASPRARASGVSATSRWRHADSAENAGSRLIAHAEQRPVPIDLAPVRADVPAWRLDDTSALVTVGPDGAGSAAAQAAELYHNLIDRRTGLATIRPGQGFTTWEGSPLWLSLAAIGKPFQMGVLPAASAPGRLQVMRTEHGEWLIEHTGGPWRAPRALRHSATAADDEALLLDILYGFTVTAPESTTAETRSPERGARRQFEIAQAAARFAGRIPGPAGWRAREAWAMVARCCAVATAQPSDDGPASVALQRMLAAVVVDGLASGAVADPLTIMPLGRDRAIAALLSGDPRQVAIGLRGLGRTTLDRVRQGRVDGIDPIEALALAACLGRLPRETARLPNHSGGRVNRSGVATKPTSHWPGVRWSRQ
jgi:hypothetical protein